MQFCMTNNPCLTPWAPLTERRVLLLQVLLLPGHSNSVTATTSAAATTQKQGQQHHVVGVLMRLYLDLSEMEEAFECDDFDEAVVNFLRFPVAHVVLGLLLLAWECRGNERAQMGGAHVLLISAPQAVVIGFRSVITALRAR